ncbi:protein-L-isoaspartate(D-aspartate) O-methyltransferase [Salinisphaera sp. USBA-960]|nr:protein-L-isoaspartate(D-aspartate) O-methyltransferase [Salifodinibacter halophilus]NNC26377.1 protein-L-isoaspartate(D-aspartate) O-methyltransferase [Salifodinibacter halophilus]
MASARSRERLIERLAATGTFDPRVLEAMKAVPRHEFVDEAMASRAYDDSALPIGHGQTISQPTIVAEMTTLAIAGMEDTTVSDQVLEIGTGSGYQAAVLAELGASVVTMERVEPLYRLSRARLARLGYRRVEARLASQDVVGLPSRAPFKHIVVTAGADHFPTELFEQLADGGCMILPLAAEGGQRLYRIRRDGHTAVREVHDAVSFVPLIQS